MRHRTAAVVIPLWFLILTAGACMRVGELRDEFRSVPIDDAEEARVDLRISTGELRLDGEASELIEADFAYNVRKWKPTVDFSTEDRRTSVTIKQGRSRRIYIGNTRNRWDVSLNRKIPLDLDVDFGAGSGRLDLSELDLRSLRVDMGVGELRLDLRGEYKRNVDVDIDGGVGSATLYLPRDIGVRVDVDGGLGSVKAREFMKRKGVYTNASYGETDNTINISIDGGIGSIELILR